MSNDALANGLSLAGTCCALFLFAAPAKTLWGCVQKGSTEEFSPLPYVMAVAQCWCWSLYCTPSITPDRTVPLCVNVFGLLIELAYCMVFAKFAPDKTGIQRWGAFVAALAVFTAVMTFLVLSASAAGSFLGIVAIILNVAMYGAPVGALLDAVKRQSVEFIPLLASVANFVNPVMWCGYSLVVHDYYIFTPNAIGVVFGAATLAVIARYTDWRAVNIKPSHSADQLGSGTGSYIRVEEGGGKE